jgi:hypothetical protein
MKLAIEIHDRGTPRCACGCFATWRGRVWACPHCDPEPSQQTREANSRRGFEMTLCQCGCGLPAPVAPRTNRSKGWIAGEPRPYRRGHAPHAPRKPAPKEPCSVPGCADDRYYSDGLCQMHHWRSLRRGDVNYEYRGESHPAWQGDQISYRTAHNRVVTQRGPARTHACIDCGEPAEHWSYDGMDSNEQFDPAHGCPYSADVTHYVPRCARCHMRVDIGGENHYTNRLQKAGAK